MDGILEPHGRHTPIRHKGFGNRDASIELPLLVALLNLRTRWAYTCGDVVWALVDNNRKRQRYKF